MGGAISVFLAPKVWKKRCYKSRSGIGDGDGGGGGVSSTG